MNLSSVATKHLSQFILIEVSILCFFTSKMWQRLIKIPSGLISEALAPPLFHLSKTHNVFPHKGFVLSGKKCYRFRLSVLANKS